MIKVGELNMRGALQTEENAKHFLEYVKEAKFDFAAFPEAFNVGNSEGLEAALDGLRALGYVAVATPYNDADKRGDKRGILAINRLPANEVPLEVSRLGTRNAVSGGLVDPSTNIVLGGLAAHFDDRSKASRLVQGAAALELGDKRFAGLGFLAAMDANDIRRSDPYTGVLRTLGKLAKPFPATEPHIGQNEHSFGVIVSKAIRGGEMAEGELISMFEAAGLTDAADHDTRATAKFLGGLAKARLDHIMFRAPGYRITDYAVNKIDPDKVFATDHLGVEAQLQHFAVSAVIES